MGIRNKRIERYGWPKDILSKRQKSTAGGGATACILGLSYLKWQHVLDNVFLTPMRRVSLTKRLFQKKIYLTKTSFRFENVYRTYIKLRCLKGRERERDQITQIKTCALN